MLMSNGKEKFIELLTIIKKLREPEGCPWDKKQTVKSFRPYLLEETHELLEALDLDDSSLVKEELGDLLFQILFLNNLYEEQGHFTIVDVLEMITDKMVRRHPHVFGTAEITSEKDLRRNWNAIKTAENRKKSRSSKSVFSFPRSLPALHRAQRVSGRAVSSGFEWEDISDVFAKLDEETAELKEALISGSEEQIVNEIGDMFFTMVNIARKAGFDAEATMHRATDKFIKRFTRIAEMAGEEGGQLEDLEIDAMQVLWSRAKKEE